MRVLEPIRPPHSSSAGCENQCMTTLPPTFLSSTRILAAVLALGAATAARAVQPLVQHDVVLLQKGEIIEQRVTGGADAMAAYLQTLGEAETAPMRAHPSQIPSAGFIVVAARPRNQADTWVGFKAGCADARGAR